MWPDGSPLTHAVEQLTQWYTSSFLPEGYAITRHRGERGAYVCRDMHTNHMYVTHWGPGFDMWGKDFNMDDVSFDELDV